MVLLIMSLFVLSLMVAWLIRANILAQARVSDMERNLKGLQDTLQSYVKAEAARTLDLAMKEVAIKTGDYDKYVEQEIGRLKGLAEKLVKDAGGQVSKDIKLARDGWQKSLDDQVSDFQVLLKNAYLSEYDKMKRTPPRPSRAPKRKVNAPDRYRSLDADWSGEPEDGSTKTPVSSIGKKRVS